MRKIFNVLIAAALLTAVCACNRGYTILGEIPVEEFNGETVYLVNVNDGTNEGLASTGKNIFTVQFHPEACPGPQDSGYLFDRFINMMKGEKENA